MLNSIRDFNKINSSSYIKNNAFKSKIQYKLCLLLPLNSAPKNAYLSK